MFSKASSLTTRIGTRALAILCVSAAVLGGLLALGAPSATADDSPDHCEITDLGTLGGETRQIETTGRWTTEDCDSAFRAGSDAHMYAFEVADGGRVRIDLKSNEADSYLYLLSDTGERIADDDDGAAGVDARIERDLAAGTYRIEATTVGGRTRGPADFSLSVGYVEGCETIDLGTLTAEADLTATGVWTLETCGSRIVETHPAYNYSFTLPASGRVRIDLTSENGDPVLSLASPAGVIGANDDGGGARNSRIEEYLPAGVYLLEATTYLQRDLQPLVADFELTIHLVDEAAAQENFLLKIEETLAPDVVIAGEPFMVDYRVGNVGGSPLPDESFVILYAVAPRTYRDLPSIPASESHWQPGVSYHSSPETASATSTTVPVIRPIEVTLSRPGPSWVFVAAIAFQLVEGEGLFDNEISFHGIWRNLRVLSGPTYGPVAVSVDGTAYSVTAKADEEGEVTTTVIPLADPTAEVEDALVVAKATYAAGVRATVLADLFERPGLAGLSGSGDPLEVSVENGASRTLLRLFAEEYYDLLADTGFAASMARGEALNPVEVEDFVLTAASKASRQYASLEVSWSAVQDQVAGGGALSFDDAFRLQAELAYAERILAPVVGAGDEIRTIRSGSMTSAAFPGLVSRLTDGGACDGAALLGSALQHAGIEDTDALLALDAELRGVLSIFREGSDAALCGASSVDATHFAFLRRLGIANLDLGALLVPLPAPEQETAPPAPEPHTLRIVALRGSDGRIQHGVELASGERILPPGRFLPAATPAGQWYVSREVEVGGLSIGQIRARRLADGRIEVGFRDSYGEAISPDVLFWPADLPLGRWVRSSEIEVPRPVAEESATE